MTEDSLSLAGDETLIHDARKHWFMIATSIAWIVFAMLLPLAIYISLLYIGPSIAMNLIESTPVIFFFYALWLLICWTVSFAVITDYMLDVVRITDKRVIDVDQKGFFNRNIATIRLEDIQDVTIQSSGIFATLLGFSDLNIQSAGHLNEFIVRGLKDPEQIRSTILEMHEKVEVAPKKVSF